MYLLPELNILSLSSLARVQYEQTPMTLSPSPSPKRNLVRSGLVATFDVVGSIPCRPSYADDIRTATPHTKLSVKDVLCKRHDTLKIYEK